MVGEGPDAIRRRVRDWLTSLLESEGAAVVLAEPQDWSGWNEETRR
jgi:hypothetical protein